MPRYRVIGSAWINTIIGEYEADSEQQAIDMALSDPDADDSIRLCHQCAIYDVGDTEAFTASKVDE